MAESDKELWKLPYYHGLLPREDTVALLKDNGDFLVRKSEENAGDKRSYVLSVIYKEAPKHYIFREEKGLIAVDFKQEKGYKTIKEFVDSHMKKKDPVCASGAKPTLSRGVPRRSWELAHASIESGAKLGSGAFGIVRRGIYKSKNGPLSVAIKEATLTKCTKEQIKEFMNEARIMRKFNHPNVIKFHGAAVGEEPLMIVMELASDGALKDYLQQHKRGIKSKIFMCMGAAAGLNHIHEKNVIHCDIAARNCLYSEQKVKIADFGLARELQGGIKEIKLDKNQRLPIKWLSPETMRERVCTYKTDVWAFGILCWEIFADGKPPYAGVQNNNEVARKVIAGERLSFKNLCKDEIPRELTDYITRHVWNGKPAERVTMNDALRWIERNIQKLVAETHSTTRDPKTGRDNSTKQQKK